MNCHFRLVTFLEKEEAQGTSVSLDSSAESDEDAKLVNEEEEVAEEEEEEAAGRKNLLRFVGASFSWQRGNSNVLHSLDLVIPSGALTVIIGKIINLSDL